MLDGIMVEDRNNPKKKKKFTFFQEPLLNREDLFRCPVLPTRIHFSCVSVVCLGNKNKQTEHLNQKFSLSVAHISDGGFMFREACTW